MGIVLCCVVLCSLGVPGRVAELDRSEAEMEQCPHCGESLPDTGDAYCSACRSPLDVEHDDNVAESQTDRSLPTEGPQISRHRDWAGSAVTFACILAVIGYICIDACENRPNPFLEKLGLILCTPLLILLAFEFILILLLVTTVLFSGWNADR